jgi:hypothetical protein
MLDRISRLEASLLGTRLEINHLLDCELEELRAFRKELLTAHDERAWSPSPTSPTSQTSKIVEFRPAPPPSEAETASDEATQAELTPLLEVASMEDLSDALAAAFKERRA